MALPPAAEQHYRQQRALVDQTTALAGQLWGRVDFADLAGSYPLDQMLLVVGVAQAQAAAGADAYLTAVLGQTGQPTEMAGTVVAGAFAGLSNDGRPLQSLLAEPVIAAKMAVARGLDRPAVMQSGLASLLRIVGTQVQDAGRGAVGTALVARPKVTGWVRVLSTPSCPRCVVLAGKWFKWNRGFQRHPRCDCRHVPASESIAGDLTTDPRKAIDAGQVRGLSKADAQAIADGADVSKVINAQRGMSTVETDQRRLKVTTESAKGRLRLRPESIYENATDRADAIRLLRSHGYLT